MIRGGTVMIKIEAIVREDKFEDVKQALQNIKINEITRTIPRSTNTTLYISSFK